MLLSSARYDSSVGINRFQTSDIYPAKSPGTTSAWPPANHNTTACNLGKVQRLTFLSIKGEMRTSPIDALEVRLEVIPLHMLVEKIAKNN